jgi:serine/threonine protein kinase
VSRDVFKLVGTTIAAKYRVERVVGEGGLGVVYAGTNLVLNVPVAIKCLKPLGGTAEDEQRLTRSFLREATVLFSLTHPGIVRLFDVGDLTYPVSVPYVVLELIDGPTLDEEIRRRALENRPFAWAEIYAIFEPILDAVSFAHQHGVTHRDLKPSNVMLVTQAGSRSAKVVDFGIARRVGEQRHTAANTGFTPRYAAPEQWDGSLGPVAACSDVFSLGLMLAEMCTLQPVLSDKGPAEIFGQLMNPTRRISVTQRRSDLPAEVDRILERATRVQQQERYVDARELLVALRNVGNTPSLPLGSPRAVFTPAAPPAIPAPARPSEGGNRTLLLALVIVLLAVAGLSMVVVWLFLERGDTRANREHADTPRPAETAEEEPAEKAKPKEPSSVSVQSIMTAGVGLTEAQETKVLEDHLGEVKDCYRKALARAPKTPGGTLLLILVVDGAGKVSSTMCGEEGIEDKALRLCLTDASAGWKFPKPGKEYGTASFMATYRFKRPL